MIFCKRKNKCDLETKQELSKEVKMSNQDIFDFIKKFNALPTIQPDLIYSAVKELDDQEQELLMVLINHKNGKEFLEKLDNGEI